jgi:hypothetical protein
MELHYNKLTKQTTVPQGIEFGQQALKTIMCPNKLSRAYFSDRNIQNLQDAIRYTVYKDTKKTIGPQSRHELLIIMRSVYLEYTKNDEMDVNQGIKDLNNRVLEYCVRQVTSSMYQYIQYVGDIGKNPDPMSRAKMTIAPLSKELENRKF